MAFWRAVGGGVELCVRVTPKGGRDALDGVVALADGREALKIRVRVAPQDGAANAAVLRTLAEAAGVAASRIHLVSGATARLKTIRIEGDGAALAAALQAAAKS